MSLIEQWRGMAGSEMSEKEYKAFWDEYYGLEKEAYKKILTRKEEWFTDKLSALSTEFKMSDAVFAGFMDGINTSLKKEYDLDKLKENTDITLEVDFEKLFYNMLDAKAKWLSSLDEWDGIFTEEKLNSIRDKWRKDKQAVSAKIERNAPCPCGSGRKYKKCCGANK